MNPHFKSRTLALAFAVFLLSIACSAAAADYADVQVGNMKYAPYPANAGQYFTLYVELDNAGTAGAQNVQFTLAPSYPFSLDAGVNPVNTFSQISAGSGALVQYRVRVASDAADGPNSLGYSYSFTQNGYNQVNQSSLNFVIQVSRQNNIRIANVTPSLIRPGVPTTLSFILENDGNSTVQGVSLQWDEATKLIVPIGAENVKYIPVLAPFATQNVDFDVVADPSASPGVYSLNTTISYLNQNATVQSASKVGILVGGQADLEVSVQDYQSGSLSLAIANTGTTPASAVSVSLPRQPGFIPAGASTQFLGNLQKGDFTVATFQVQSFSSSAGTGSSASPGAGGGRRFGGGNGGGAAFNGTSGATNGTILVQVAYTDTLGTRQVEQLNVPFDTGLLANANFLGVRTQNAGLPWYVYALGLAIAAGVGYFAYRKWWMKHSSASRAQTPPHAGKESK